MCLSVLSHSIVFNSVTTWTAASQAPLPMRILQARILGWVPSSRGSSQPRDWTQISHITGGFFTIWATRKVQEPWGDSLSLLKGIFPTQEMNQCLHLCRWILYQLSYQRSLNSSIGMSNIKESDYNSHYNIHSVSSVQFSLSVVSDTLWHHELWHARPPCPSPSPGVHWNTCPLSQWCHPTILSSAVPFSSHLQSFPASGSFQMSQFFCIRWPSITVSASASVLPVNIQDWSPLGWTGWISLWSKGLSRVFSSTTVQKHQFFGSQISLQSNSHIHTGLLEKP